MNFLSFNRALIDVPAEREETLIAPVRPDGVINVGDFINVLHKRSWMTRSPSLNMQA